jgi:hypothetical protein
VKLKLREDVGCRETIGHVAWIEEGRRRRSSRRSHLHLHGRGVEELFFGGTHTPT